MFDPKFTFRSGDSTDVGILGHLSHLIGCELRRVKPCSKSCESRQSLIENPAPANPIDKV